MNILEEYEMDGRWIFLRIDSAGKLNHNYELIHPMNIYEAYTDNFTKVDRQFFLFNAYQTFRQQKQEQLERFPQSHPIKGMKVNMKRYDVLKKITTEKLLSTYFNKDKTLKDKYAGWLHEIIAVCYTNNIKVITPSSGYAYYELFK
ncbi:hypothetical protein [Ferruginibacter sp. SUN106]|uniref:hypothetical protein n=1 Tax=Ferruginibacter sp. SUN106 TaxID=2978348 RepID=UPI003D36B9A3